MSDKVYNVLFVCTHNSARSIMAEGLLNSLGRGRFKGWSAGSHPGDKVNPFALKTLASMHIPADRYRSKNWEEFARPGAPELDFVLTVCDNAAGEVCPVWPGQPTSAHWGVADPSAFEGTDEQKEKCSATRQLPSSGASKSCSRSRCIRSIRSRSSARSGTSERAKA